MGQLLKKLNIDPCPNCDSIKFEFVRQGKYVNIKHVECANCHFEYEMHYISPGASLAGWYVDQVNEDIFKLFARNI